MYPNSPLQLDHNIDTFRDFLRGGRRGRGRRRGKRQSSFSNAKKLLIMINDVFDCY